MEHQQFDSLTKQLGQGTARRDAVRGGLAALAGVLGLAAVSREGTAQSSAAKKNKNKKAVLTTRRVSRNVDLRSGERNLEVTINCSSGEQAIGSGWEFRTASDSAEAFAATNRPTNSSNSRSWTFVFHKSSVNRSISLIAYAVCAPRKN